VSGTQGLEWSVVVVPDLSRKAANQATTVCFDPALGLALKLPNAAAELEKPALFRLIEQVQKQRDYEESKRLLYVALTRARDQLLLTSAEEQGGNLELLEDCLVDEAEAIPYDADHAYPIAPTMPGLPTVPSIQLLRTSGPGLTELPVKALTEYARCPKQFHYYYVEGHSGYREGMGNFAAEVGTLTHLALERDIQMLEALMPMADGLSVEKVAEAFELAQQFRRSPTFEALREVGAEYERSVTLALPQLTLRGQIDLVGRDWVADFKTDQEMNPQAHRFQLWAYAQAAGKPVAHIAYLRTDTLHTFTAADLQAIGQEARTIVQGIQEGHFEATPSENHCGSCSYGQICQSSSVLSSTLQRPFS
jgi:ATP-dependent helicase/nuclease subunit A